MEYELMRNLSALINQASYWLPLLIWY